MKMSYSIPIGIFILGAGVAVFITSFFSQIFEVKIALLIAAVGLIASGIAQLGQSQEKKQDEEKHKQVMEKLEKIEKEIEKLEEPKGKGVAIADILGAGLKYYAEHMTKSKKEEEND
jgi:ABC-type transport system involved in cytochrome bd biosynthesis fused ATPase/permease subunit